MQTLYLKATSEAALIAALPFARTENRWLEATEYFALDIIGDFYEITDGWPVDENGVLRTTPMKFDGYHANIRCSDEIAALIPVGIIVFPKTPRRAWL